MADKTSIIIMSADDGTDDTDIEDVKESKHTVRISPVLKSIPFICAIKIDDTATITAVPSIFVLHPIGRTNFVTRGSIFIFSSITRNVIGSAAALKNRICL